MGPEMCLWVLINFNALLWVLIGLYRCKCFLLCLNGSLCVLKGHYISLWVVVRIEIYIFDLKFELNTNTRHILTFLLIVLYLGE